MLVSDETLQTTASVAEVEVNCKQYEESKIYT